jgi:cell division protein FtsL
MMFKRILMLIFVCTIPAVLFFSSVQAYNYTKLQDEIEALETQQKDWIEKNKKLIASIEVLRTPKRIEKIAEEDLQLEKIDKERIKKVVFE